MHVLSDLKRADSFDAVRSSNPGTYERAATRKSACADGDEAH